MGGVLDTIASGGAGNASLLLPQGEIMTPIAEITARLGILNVAIAVGIYESKS